MLQRRTIVTAFAAGLLLLTGAPLRAADTASPGDTARFLAGMPVSPDSPLAPLTKDGSWQQHARSFDGAFGQLDKGQLARIRAWSEKNIIAPPPTVFYMFSGPDFLYANAFYPNAKTYVLAGLEPVGTVPDLTTLRGSLTANLYHIHGSISSLLSHTFFITHQMRSDLNVGRVNGTLPILYVFLARSGKTVRETTLVRVDEQGAIQTDTGGSRGNAAHGVKIVFTGNDDEPRTLYYFSTNLADDGVKSSNFLKFLETLAPGDGLVKSASYLLHSGGFTKIRDFLLANCSAMVQDDSGIPLRYYDSKKWDFHPFGRYLGPIGVFPGRYQSNYAALFRNSRSIDFGMGYRWRSSESNVLLAVKKPEAAAAEAALRPRIEEGSSSGATQPATGNAQTATSATQSDAGITPQSSAAATDPAPAHQRRYVRRHRTLLDWFRVR